MLDEGQRKERARKAALVAGRKRTARTLERDRLILLLYRYLGGLPMPKKDSVDAYNHLKALGRGVSLPADTTPYRFLADTFGLTRSRVRQIVKTDKNSSLAAKNNDFTLIG